MRSTLRTQLQTRPSVRVINNLRKQGVCASRNQVVAHWPMKMTLDGFGSVFCIVQRNQQELQLRSYRWRKQQCGGSCVNVWCLDDTASKWYNHCCYGPEVPWHYVLWFFSLGMCQRPGIRPTIATWPRWPKGTDHCNSEEYWCTHVDACVARTWISYRCVLCHTWCTHRTSLGAKKLFQFFCGCEQFHWGRSFGFLVINVYNHGEHWNVLCNEISHCGHVCVRWPKTVFRVWCLHVSLSNLICLTAVFISSCQQTKN